MMAALYKQEGTKRQLETVGLSSLRALAVVQQAVPTGAHIAEQSAEAGLQQSLAEAQGEALRQAQSLCNADCLGSWQVTMLNCCPLHVPAPSAL